MSSAAPRTRPGLIGLLVARRVKAERERRRQLAQANAHRDAEAAETARDAGKTAKRAGWFRR